MKKMFNFLKINLVVFLLIILFCVLIFNLRYRIKDRRNKVLLCGFEKFGKNEYNVSWNAIKEYNKKKELDNSENRVEVIKLPVSYDRVEKVMLKKIKKFMPDIMIVFSMGSLKINPKSIILHPIAMNLDNSEKPDNDGNYRRNELIKRNGPVAFWSTIPMLKIKSNLEEVEIESKTYNFTGNYLSNHAFYELMYIVGRYKDVKMAGMIHLPPYNENFSREDAIKSVNVIVDTCLSNLGKDTKWPPKK